MDEKVITIGDGLNFSEHLAGIIFKKSVEDVRKIIKEKFGIDMEINEQEQSKDYFKCSKCLDEEHEGISCRCESRNIRIAKERRARGELWY